MNAACPLTALSLLLSAAGLGIYGWWEHRQLHPQQLAFERQAAASSVAIERAARERDAAEREIDALTAPLTHASDSRTRLPSAPPRSVAEVAWQEKVATLRSLLVQHPGWDIPETALLTPEEFIFFARDVQLDGEENQRKALRDLRNLAKRKIAPLLQTALHDHALEHRGRMPGHIRELARHIDPPLPEAVLHRYALTGVATVAAPDQNEWLLFERTPVDELYDTRQVVGSTLLGQIATNPAIYVLARALATYSDVNDGGRPVMASELERYLEVPLDAATLNKYFESWRESPADLGIHRFAGGVVMRRPPAAR